MEIYLCRHGETVDNLKRIIQGHQPGQLTERGFLQAQLLAKKLANVDFSAMFSSDLNRCVQTMIPSLEYHNKTPIFYEKEIREKCHGIFEGLPSGSDSIFTNTIDLAELREFRPENGESMIDVYNRANKFLDLLLETYLIRKTDSDSDTDTNTNTDTGNNTNEKTYNKYKIDNIDNSNSVTILVVTHSGFMSEFINVIKTRQNNEILLKNIINNTGVFRIKISCKQCTNINESKEKSNESKEKSNESKEKSKCSCQSKSKPSSLENLDLSYEFITYNDSSHLESNSDLKTNKSETNI